MNEVSHMERCGIWGSPGNIPRPCKVSVAARASHRGEARIETHALTVFRAGRWPAQFFPTTSSLDERRMS